MHRPYYALLILIAGLTLATWLLGLITLLIAATMAASIFLTPLAPGLTWPGSTPLQVRFALVSILVTLALFIAAISWIVARTTRAGFEGAQRAFMRERELVKLKDQLIVSANHELRTPIMALYGNVEFLMALGERITPEQRTTLLQRALGAGDILLGLLNTIFDASLAESKLQLAPRTLAIGPLITALLEAFDPREIGEPALAPGNYQARDITLVLPPNLTVYADEKRLRQVLLNLLSNALKYSEPGTPITITAEIVAAAEPAMVQITVRDRGLGIPPAEAGQLFQQFARLPRDIAGKVRGTGMGLYLCRLLIEAMGGCITVASTGIPGEGASFIFTLPQVAPEPVPTPAMSISKRA